MRERFFRRNRRLARQNRPALAAKPFAHGPLDPTHHHHRRGVRPGAAARLRRRAAEAAALGGLPAGRHRDRPGHARFRGRREDRRRAGRDRRHAADVRCRPALFGGRPDVGAQDRAARRHRADRGGHRNGRRRGAVVGLGPAGGAWCSGSRCRWPARWCCSRRSSARACSTLRTAASRSAGWWWKTWRWCWCWCCCRRWPGCSAPAQASPPQELWTTLAVTMLKVAGVRRADAGGRAARVPVAAVAGHTHRLARAVHAVRGGRCGQHRVGLGAAVRRVVRARCVLRRHGAARIAVQPPRGARHRCRCAMRSRCCSSSRWACCSTPGAGRRTAARADGAGHHRGGQVDRRRAAGAADALPAEHRAHGVGQPGADRRVLVHPRRRSAPPWACCPTKDAA